MSDSAVFAAASVALFAVGVACGAIGAWFITSRSFQAAAQIQRTGRVGVPAPIASVLPGGELRLDPASVDGSDGGPALERVQADEALARIIDRGADQFMSVEPRLTREQARAKARRALRETGAFNAQGGIPSA